MPLSADEDYERVKKIVMKKQIVTIPTIQRIAKLGYFEAHMIVDRLEKEGIIGPVDDEYRRTVLVHSNQATQER